MGVVGALELILSGARIAAELALQKGLIDAIVEGDITSQAIAYARKLIADNAAPKRVGDLHIDPRSVPPASFAQARARVAEKAGDAIAPAKIVDCIEAAVTMPFADGMAFERARLCELIDSPQSIALRRAFFEERAKK